MKTTAISERGQFWLASEGQPTTQSATRGTLFVYGEGTISLTLDFEDWKWSGATETIETFMARRYDIIGYLPGSNKYVRLENAFTRQPRLLPSSFAAERIGADTCLMSNERIIADGPQAGISELRISLRRLWAWLDRPMPEVHKSPTYYAIHYPIDSRQEYLLHNSRITVETETSIKHDGKRRTMALTQNAWIYFEFESPLNADKAAKLYTDIEDLLVLLTDQECGLDWPHVKLRDSEGTGVLYCPRMRTTESEISAFDCWVPFFKIADEFGSIVDNWIQMREEPAFHLYLGTRRNTNQSFKSFQVRSRFQQAGLIWASS